MAWRKLRRNRGSLALGYRYPDKYELDEEAHKQLQVGVGFDEQFEDGSHGEILFYRGGVGRPVRASEEERADACDRWERYSPRLTLAYVAAAAIAVIALLYRYGPDEMKGSALTPLAVLVPLAGFGLARGLLRNHIVRPFRGRFPAGPVRTRWLHYSAKANAVGWRQLGAAMASLLSLLLMRATFAGGDAFHRGAAMVELIFGSGIFLIAAVKIGNWINRR